MANNHIEQIEAGMNEMLKEFSKNRNYNWSVLSVEYRGSYIGINNKSVERYYLDIDCFSELPFTLDAINVYAMIGNYEYIISLPIPLQDPFETAKLLEFMVIGELKYIHSKKGEDYEIYY